MKEIEALNLPSDLRYSEDHGWVRMEGELAVVGITDYAQKELSDVVFVELPKVGQDILQGRAACVVESVKAASDVYAPVSGKVIAINKELELDYSQVNKDPYGKGWFYEVAPSKAEELDSLLSAEQYDAIVHQKA